MQHTPIPADGGLTLIPGDSIVYALQSLEQQIKNFMDAYKPPPTPVLPEYITRNEACKRLHVTLPTLHRWQKIGKIRAKRVGRRVLIPVSEITSLMPR